MNKNTISYNPANHEKIGVTPVITPDKVKKTVDKAKDAQRGWSTLPLKTRIKHIKKIVSFIAANSELIADTISKDNGKTKIEALATEVVSAAMAASFYCKNAASFLKDKSVPSGNILFVSKKSIIRRVPYGAVGIISPWNYPFSIPFSEVIMALLAGNSVVLKAATETQMVAKVLKDCIESARIPDNVFTAINIPGSLAGDALLNAGIDKLFFTGSVAVGKYLMKKASDTLTPLCLELGGNDAMIVCEDADLERAASGAVWAGFQNAGQSCGGVERIYVHEKIYDEFLKLIKSKVEALKIGDSADPRCEIGAMTTMNQMEKVRSHIKEALKKGAVIYARSDPDYGLKGNFLPCIVLTKVNHRMKLMTEETFGPVVGVMPFSDIDEAVCLANDSNLGLTASVWSKDRENAKNIARRIEAGTITINDHLMSHGLAGCPWGGFKESGIGRTHGEIGFQEMTRPQVIVNDIMPFMKRDFWWHPYDGTLFGGIKGAVDFLYGRSPFARIIGGARLAKSFMRTFKKKL